MDSDADIKELERALAGLDYPAPRNKLMNKALENRAPRSVIDRILELPETSDFMDESQLHDALGVRIPGTRPRGWQ